MDGWGWGGDGGGGGLLSVLADVVDIDVGDGLQHVDIKGCGCDGGAPWRACRPWLAMEGPSLPSLCSGHAQAVFSLLFPQKMVFSLHDLNMLEAIISPLP
uniref:Uncharacterized protein n=1 Tax=Aegilops tauschii subsp. strangulata TaxID=200361 RepID=A0A453RNQ8_AEGTS